MVARGIILLIFALGMASFIIVEGCIISSLATEEKISIETEWFAGNGKEVK